MFFLYNLLGFFFLIISPVILLIRVVIGKEDIKRVLEKYSFFRKEKFKATVWFHGASVGEIMSILPIIKKFENDKSIKKILLTSTTVSSASIIEKKKLKKTTHVYFPFDVNFICNNFLKNWKPKIAVFVDSEIWPNMFKKLEANGIPIILINGRITKKSFEKWKKFPTFAKKTFSKITLALPQNHESKIYLKKLGVNKLKYIGNLKYFREKEKRSRSDLKQYFKNRRIFCAASTHYNEEKLIGKLHLDLKKKYQNLITILIPRHINRSNSISNELKELDLNVIRRSSGKKPNHNCDIYIVDTYGEMSKFLKFSKITFVGGSLVNHGGQNPLEAVSLGNYIIHGKKVGNFKEIYEKLKKLSIATEVENINDMKQIFSNKYNYKKSKRILKKIENMGEEIFRKNILEIKNYLR